MGEYLQDKGRRGIRCKRIETF